MVDKKLSQFDEVSTGDVSYFPVLDGNTKNAKIAGTKAMPWTNCITEIPQDIKLSLNNGTLTLLSGSKAYIPNGTGVFDVVNISGDKIVNCGSTTGKCLVRVYPDGGTYGDTLATSFISGADPSGITAMFYNTATNKLTWTNNGVSDGNVCSFPIAEITVSNGTVTSIDKVFNGFGYVGPTVFALPGVKCLIPNGRNSDGTLKNTLLTVSSVKTATFTGVGIANKPFIINSSGIYSAASNTYNENENKNSSGSTCVVGLYSTDSTPIITSLNVKTSFLATDYSEFKATKDDMMTLSTSQNVTANKTYYGVQNFYGRNRAVFLQSEIDSTVNPSSAKYGGALNLCDKNGVSIGYMDSTQYTSGQIYSRLGVTMLTSGGSRIYPYLNACGDKDGNQWAEAPTPSAVTDNTNKIATTQWFNNKVKVVSALPANPVNGVFYFITD